MLAFHNNPSIKEKYLSRVRAHRAADDIVRGRYGNEEGISGWRGCAVGCTIHGESHIAYEIELGIPKWLAVTEDNIFEFMSADKAPDWPIRFLEAIQVGADLSTVFDRWMQYLLIDDRDGVLQYTDQPGKEAIQKTADLIRRKMDGESVPLSVWQENAAAAVAYADAAAYAAAAYANAAAANAAYANANADANANANAAAAYARDIQAEKLLEMLVSITD